MLKEEAFEIMCRHRLIPGSVSRQILKKIISADSMDEKELQAYISVEEFQELKTLYQKKCATEGEARKGKYAHFYSILQDKYPLLADQIFCDVPRVENLRASLLSLLLGRVNLSMDTPLYRKYPSVRTLPPRTLEILSNFMSQAKAVYPNNKNMGLITQWLTEGTLHHAPSTIFLPLCPDYAVEPTGDLKCPFRHTFQSLGSGVGQIAKRLVEVLPLLQDALRQLDFQPNIVAGMADFEGFSKENLQRLGLTQSEFIDRADLSRLAFEKATGVKTVMISSLLENEADWRQKASTIQENFTEKNFGLAPITDRLILKIIENRQALYTRWYGVKESIKDFIPLVLGQGAEYALMGTLLSKAYPNCLVLGADNDLFGSFYSYTKPTPTLYLKRFYC